MAPLWTLANGNCVCSAQSASTALHAATTARYTVRVPPSLVQIFGLRVVNNNNSNRNNNRNSDASRRRSRWRAATAASASASATNSEHWCCLLQPARCACAARFYLVRISLAACACNTLSKLQCRVCATCIKYKWYSETAMLELFEILDIFLWFYIFAFQNITVRSANISQIYNR